MVCEEVDGKCSCSWLDFFTETIFGGYDVNLFFSVDFSKSRSEIIENIQTVKTKFLSCRFFESCNSSSKSLKWARGSSYNNDERKRLCVEFCRANKGMPKAERGGRQL